MFAYQSGDTAADYFFCKNSKKNYKFQKVPEFSKFQKISKIQKSGYSIP